MRFLATFCLMTLCFKSYAFNDDFETSSSTELSEDGMVSTKVLANLPYSACESDEIPLSPEHCRQASLTVGSPIYNLLVVGSLGALPRHNLQLGQAESLAIGYTVGSQYYNRRWSIPTLGQLQWMINKKLLNPTDGERFWVQTSDQRGLRQVRWKTFANNVFGQTSSQASVYRLANEQTPSDCNDEQCTNFVSNDSKDFYVVVKRNNLVHDMYARVDIFKDGRPITSSPNSAHTGWSANWTDVVVPAGAAANFVYSTVHASSVQGLQKMENIQNRINWLYDKPTLCWVSGGTIFSVTIGSSPHSMDYSEVNKKCK